MKSHEVGSVLERRRAGSPEALKQDGLAKGRRLWGTEHRRENTHRREPFPAPAFLQA